MSATRIQCDRFRVSRWIQLCIASALVFSTGLAAQTPLHEDAVVPVEPVDEMEWEPLRIVRPDRAFLFPQRYLIRGYPVEGYARVIVDVDENGSVVDFVTIEASHLEFARAVERDLPDVRFLPARHQGEPVQTRSVLHVNFRAEGVASSITLQEHQEIFLEQMRAISPEPFLKVTAEGNLDRPLERVDDEPATLFVSEDGTPVTGAARVAFFVDREGAVRLPRVLSSDNREVAESAFQTVLQWRFTPPREQGNPRVVRVVVPFNITG